MPNTSARKAPATAARELNVYVGILPLRSPLISKKEKEQPVSMEETLATQTRQCLHAAKQIWSSK